MGVLELRSFMWGTEGALNEDRNKAKWRRTQALPPLCEVNSSVFAADVGIYRDHQDRIGARPLLRPVSQDKTIDVDWEEDFLLAAELWKLRRVD